MSKDIQRSCLEKSAFLTKDEAKRAKHVLRKTSGQKVSIYHCDNCKCWHFTRLIETD